MGLLVSLQAAIEAELPYLRAEAESRMVDTVDIKVATGGWVYDEDAGKDVQEFTLLFSTPARIKSGGVVAHDSQAGDRTVVTVTRELHIPVASAVVPDGAVAFVTAVSATSDPTLLNARLRVAGPAPGSQTTARRLQVEEVLT